MSYDPTTVSDLYARWKATTCSGVGDGGAVTTWTDSVSSIAPTQATSAQRPTYRASVAGLNSKPALEFDKTADQKLVATSGGAALMRGSTQTYTVFVACRLDSIATGQYHGMFSVRESGSQFYRAAMSFDTNGESTTSAYASAYSQANGSLSSSREFTGSTSYVFTLSAGPDGDGGDMTTWINGTAKITDTDWYNWASDTDLVRIGVGTTDSGTEFDGWIAEILVYHRVLTLGERATVHSYLQDEYGITVSDYLGTGVTPGTLHAYIHVGV